MALGTLTVIDSVAGVGPVFHDNVSVVGDSSYPTNGSAGLAAKLRTAKNDAREIVEARCYDGSGYTVEYDPATDKIKAFKDDDGNPSAEVANATDLSGVTFKFHVVSK